MPSKNKNYEKIIQYKSLFSTYYSQQNVDEILLSYFISKLRKIQILKMIF